jgi:hypothetical protein
MLFEVGIVVCLFVAASLIPPELRKIKLGVSWLVVVVATLVAVDLFATSIADNSRRSLASHAQDLTAKTSVASEHPKQTAQPAVSAPANVNVTRSDGGSITTNLGYGIAVAKESTLHREWIAIGFRDAPVSIHGVPGVKTIYKSGEYRGEYFYQADFELEAKKDISALEVRFLVFDVWGNHVRTLTFEDVADHKAGSVVSLKGSWNLYSENEVEKHYASIAYVARVRLADGKIIEAPIDAVVEEARKFESRFTAKELEPDRPEPEKKPS